MTLASPAPPPPRRSNGCLWGCLGLVLIMVLPFVLAGAYGAWFLYEGFRHDPVLRAASELVRDDGMAHLALGNDIQVTGVEGNAFSFTPGIGASNSYVVDLTGDKGEGRLAVTAHTVGAQVKLDTAILIGPDGRRYDLIAHAVLPGDPHEINPAPDSNSI